MYKNPNAIPASLRMVSASYKKPNQTQMNNSVSLLAKNKNGTTKYDAYLQAYRKGIKSWH